MDSINLNGAWQCTFPDGTRAAVRVPGCFDTAAERWDIGGPVLYERTFQYAGEGAARLVFGGVSHHCEAALNGHPLGSHVGI
jgi:beta-galactosidase/beta-glucuronidase